MDFSISSNRLNHLKPIQTYVYIFGVKSNLENETCASIYFNSVFRDMFISLKNETEQTWILQHTFPIYLHEKNISKHITNGVTNSQAGSSHQ